MLTPAAVILLASYVGPTASSEVDPNDAPSTYQAGTGIEENTEIETEPSDKGNSEIDAEDVTSQTQATDDDLNQEDTPPEPVEAEEGRMVVPPGLQ